MRHWFRRIAAAAIIILILGVGTYFLFFNPTHKPNVVATEPIEKRYKNDVSPGTDGAILTLSEGTKINMDSVSNGTIAQQGNVQVLKQGDLVSYNKKSKATGKVMYNTMTTTRGKKYSFVLADGSKIIMNSESSITYPTSFTGTERRVQFTGEVYFEVAPLSPKGGQGKVPFIVSTKGIEVEVLGTHFNINAYNDEAIIKTTLVEGSVKVTNGTNTTLLSPGQQAQVSKKGEITLVKDADVDEALAWINGMFDFKSADIETIMRQIGRWYDVDVVYEKNIPVKEIRGKASRNTNLSSLLKVLEINGVHFKIEGRKITVMP